MIRTTKGAQTALESEISKYKDFLIGRAIGYADQDDSLEIRENHIKKAARDFRNDFYEESWKRIVSKKRRKFSYLMMLAITLSAILYAFIIFFIFSDNREDVSLLISLCGLFVSLTMMMYLLKNKDKSKQDDSVNHKMILSFLNKWNELESLLRNLYKKTKHKEAGTFVDLLDFYRDIDDIRHFNMQDSIYMLLNARNNIMHRSIKDVNVNTISGLNEEMDMIIEILRNA